MNDRERQAQEARRNAAKEWAEEKDQGGWTPTAVKLPANHKKFKMEAGTTVSFDVIPYLAGWGNPRADVGKPIWAREYDIHPIPRPDGEKDSYVCLWNTFKKPCYFCQKLKQPGMSEDMKKDLRPRLRLLMLVNPELDKKLTGPFQVLDEAYFNRKVGFGERLKNTIKFHRGDEVFFDLVGGLTITISVANNKFHQIDHMQFDRRGYDYDLSLPSSVPCLDDCILVPRPKGLDKPLKDFTDSDWKAVYLEQENIWNGGNPGEAMPPSTNGSNGTSASSITPAPSVSQPLVSQPTQRAAPLSPPPPPKVQTAQSMGLQLQDRVEYDGGTCTIIRIAADGSTVTLEDDKEEILSKVPVTKVKKLGGGKTQTAKVDTSEDPDDDDIPF